MAIRSQGTAGIFRIFVLTAQSFAQYFVRSAQLKSNTIYCVTLLRKQ